MNNVILIMPLRLPWGRFELRYVVDAQLGTCWLLGDFARAAEVAASALTRVAATTPVVREPNTVPGRVDYKFLSHEAGMWWMERNPRLRPLWTEIGRASCRERV